jgi:arylsulfatase A-like enzyme
MRIALSCICALFLLACMEPPVPPAEVRQRLRDLDQPNVVLLVCDTLRADWLTPYGFEENTSPELQRWAERGVTFERTRSQSSWTKTSMASLMTSLWPTASGVIHRKDGLAPAALTLAELFQGAGYRTYGVQANGWLEQTFGFEQGFDRYMFPRGGGNASMRTSIWPHADNVYREAMRLLDAHQQGDPFLLYLHFMDVHEYGAPAEFHTFGSDSAGAYRAAIRWVDSVVERLRENLDDRGLLDRTILVFASDHGEAFGENNLHGHAKNVLTSTVNVPLMISMPFPMEPTRISAQVRNVDLMPTLVDLAGIPVPESLQGESLLPWIEDPSLASDRPTFASLDERLFPDASLQKAVSDGEWTFARNWDEEGNPGRELLFDRRVDPQEDVDLIDVEPESAARIRAIFDAHLAAPNRHEAREADVRIDPRLAEKLKALGYAEDE